MTWRSSYEPTASPDTLHHGMTGQPVTAGGATGVPRVVVQGGVPGWCTSGHARVVQSGLNQG